MKHTIKCILLVTLVTARLVAIGNDEPPKVNTKSPDFTFTDIKNWKKKTASLKDFKGKWLVIDAWSVGCIACVGDFPKFNEIYKEMKDRANFILLGKEHRYIRTWYEKYRTKKNLVMPYVFDSAFFKLYQINAVPRGIVIDPNGIIRAITSEEFTKEKLEQLFTGKNPFIQRVDAGELYPFDYHKPIGVNGNGVPDESFLFRSMLTRWKYSQGDITPTFDSSFHWSKYMKNGFQMMAADLTWLYKVAFIGRVGWLNTDTAYYGKYSLNPAFEIRDTSITVSDYLTAKNMFCYSLIVPDSLATNVYLQKRMQKDLDYFFNFKTTIEERDEPVWEATCTRSPEHLRTKGGPEIGFYGLQYSTSYKVQNRPIWELFRPIVAIFQSQPIVIDKTGIDFNIDIDLDCIPTDFESVKNALEKEGIRLVRTTKKMKVVVVRDAD